MMSNRLFLASLLAATGCAEQLYLLVAHNGEEKTPLSIHQDTNGTSLTYAEAENPRFEMIAENDQLLERNARHGVTFASTVSGQLSIAYEASTFEEIEHRVSAQTFYACSTEGVVKFFFEKRDEDCNAVDIRLTPFCGNVPMSEHRGDCWESEGTEGPGKSESEAKDGSNDGLDDSIDSANASYSTSRNSTSRFSASSNSSSHKAESYEHHYSSTNHTNIVSICDVCEYTTELKTYTNHVTYCPEPTTVTVTVCEEACQATTIPVSTATTLTITGVCIIPETVRAQETTVKGAIETGKAGAHGSTSKKAEQSDSGKQHVEGKQGGDSGKQHVEGKQKGEPNKEAGKNDSGKQKGEPNKEAGKNDSGKQKGEPSKEAGKNDSGKQKGEPSKEAGKNDKPKPKAVGTSSANNGTAQSVSALVNGAPRNAIGACVLGVAALLL